ncbi:Fe-S cluster assembly sulfur transfer protein SufU [Spelaeicoccus albus]|uniref:Nitrogen fixation NifU-like protein n=1 Tax=Spelaeicoccus albus TaxID=1280376 RepID=A0A7Z0D447_9MICO|nr:SUF system NifU family Fe-S cluster assembly protein [Spelaeicoccus albus]NYI68513.1 nitrogen fixation NifU-like protein [Spelaeicoccus albus]
MSSDLENLYQQVILDHSKKRNGNEPLTDPAWPGRSHQVNPTCGDEITLEVNVAEPDGAIEIRWDGQGCSISMASASVLTDLVGDVGPDGIDAVVDEFNELMHSRGKADPDEEVLGDAAAFSGVSKYPARIKCALLAWAAFSDALRQARTMKG